MENKIGERIYKTKLLSSLEKVFCDENCIAEETKKGSMLLNERFSFQLAFVIEGERLDDVSFSINSEIKDCISIKYVENVPSQMPCYHNHDDNILRNTPGFYPDVLVEMPKTIRLLNKQWRSIWITIEPKDSLKAGDYDIEICMNQNNLNLTKDIFNIEIIDKKLPEQDLIYTNWFHCDCIATYYNIPVFSEEHFKRIEDFIKTASDYGMNMILTPIFTPALDTEVGKERPTVQLVDVYKNGDKFEFSFEKLKRFIDMCLKYKIKHFEYSPFFTQWGSKFTPKIMAKENGEYKRIFGWDTLASSDEYKNFLNQFLPRLVEFIKKENLQDKSWFHISDEPSLNDMENYQCAYNLIKDHIKDFKTLDAISNYEFYEKGYIKAPVVATDHIDIFLENRVENLWAYYCCVQYKGVSNKFFNMPSHRNRILGMQLYKYDIQGFLHWGYNFWYSQFSKYPINPYLTSDAGCGFPSGDAYVVYPSQDGVNVSLRLEVFYDALQDLRALKLLETKLGKEKVIEIIEEECEITFSKYKHCSKWLLKLREKINSLIKELV
ncbi:DUF4091 domain-containing protein [uncultured Tyzzerella sp.]|uniref:DUF4091 domain-containing protein n=1 Tax=uncultured Tyzzerella sp. TaxID=2321398 RepID=UPI0029424C15|nr:DUF4091 domain-containing protein [uncultured Tyzzerella sp.]